MRIKKANVTIMDVGIIVEIPTKKMTLKYSLILKSLILTEKFYFMFIILNEFSNIYNFKNDFFLFRYYWKQRYNPKFKPTYIRFCAKLKS